MKESKCIHCGKKIYQDEADPYIAWSTSKIFFNVACPESDGTHIPEKTEED
jgi:DNA-directed RNA polymerase subunit RPC12/RpoP